MTHRIASAVARKSWHWNLLNLAWTVGPVTFIALQFGHYLGFGSKAPLENFYYFGGYTLIAGTCALLASILHDAIQRPRIDKEQTQLLESIDMLHATMMRGRDEILNQLDVPARKIMSAYYILQSVGASPSAIEAAVFDLTGNAELTAMARRAHVYNEHGMQSRVQDIFQEATPFLREAQQTLHAIAPQAYTMLENRLQGITPSVRLGIERSEGFIERILSAAESNDMTKLTLYDVQELLTLTLELLSSRKIAVLEVRLKGEQGFEKAQMLLDQTRYQYRVALRKRNSQIRLLAERLYAQTDMGLVVEATDATLVLIDAIKRSIAALPASQQPLYRVPYERILSLNELVRTARERLLKAEAAYSKSWQKNGRKLTLAMQEEDLKKAGFYIEERHVSLSDKQKLKLAHFIQQFCEKETAAFTAEHLKRFAMELANELDAMVDMSQPEEQLAIESSNATDFGYITKKLAPKTKAGWAAIAVEAMQENRRKASHRLARSLTLFYQLPLTEAIIALFIKQFGADEEYLRSLNALLAGEPAMREEVLPALPPSIITWKNLVHAET